MCNMNASVLPKIWPANLGLLTPQSQSRLCQSWQKWLGHSTHGKGGMVGQLLLLQPQQFAGRLPPGWASNRNQKKNGRGLRPLRVLYVGPFWGPILLSRPPPHVCSVLVVCPLLPAISKGTRIRDSPKNAK